MPILAMSAGTVTAIWGAAYIQLPDGTLKPVHVGDKVVGGERIITDQDGIVQISPRHGPHVLVQAEPAPSPVDKAIAGLDSQDPDQAPAAGLSGGADGGLQPGLRVERVAETVGHNDFSFAQAERGVDAFEASSADQRPLSGAGNEGLPQLAIGDLSVNEGAGTATFTVTLDRAYTEPVTVRFSTQPGGNGTATVESGGAQAGSASDGDYVPQSGTLTFQPGETSQTIAVPLKNDAVYEGAETFSVVLSAPVNAVLDTAIGTATIHDDGTGSLPEGLTPDDDRPHLLALGDPQVAEGGTLDFAFQLSHESTTVTPLVFTLAGVGAHPATPGTDTGPQLTLSLGDGLGAVTLSPDAEGRYVFNVPAHTAADTVITVHVPTVADGVTEGPETLALSAVSPYNDAPVVSVGTILDGAHVLSVSDASAPEGAPLNFTVAVDALPTDADGILHLQLVGNGDHPATPGTDTGQVFYSLDGGLTPIQVDQVGADGRFDITLPAGTTADSILVQVVTTADGVSEGVETLQLQVAGPGNTAPLAGQGSIDDRPYMLVREGEPATEGQPVHFFVELTAPSDQPVTFALELQSGVDDPRIPGNESATLGVDTAPASDLEYLSANGDWLKVTGPLSFAPGQTQVEVRLATVDDSEVELTEFVKLQATRLSGDTVNEVHANQTAIIDNDQPYLLVLNGEPAVEGHPIAFHVVLTHASIEPVKVALALQSGTDDPDTPQNESATVGVDVQGPLQYLDDSGQWVDYTDGIVFQPGATEVVVRVASVDDQLAEDTEFIKLQATVESGQTVNQTHANQTAIIDNDSVPGVIEPVHAQVSALDTNLMIVLDVSGSMNSASGIGELSRLQAAVQAIDTLLDRYDQYGDVAVRLVTFASEAQAATNGWVSVAQAKALLDGLEAGQGGTFYNRALAEAQAAFETSEGRLDHAQNVAYFLSDGVPTEPIAGQTVPRDGHLSDAQAQQWLDFIDAHQLKSYAIGMGGDVSHTFLDGIAFDGQAVADTGSVIVSQFNQLEGVLSGTTNDVVQGSLVAGGAMGLADSHVDHVASVTVDGVAYTYDALGSSHLLALTTNLGGQLNIDLATGAYSYTAPAQLPDGVSREEVAFTLVDAQQQQASSTLDILVDHAHVMVGTADGETLAGTSTSDLLMGRQGDDVLLGGGGHDQLFGNAGQDELHGGAGHDLLVGGGGDDLLFGEAGADVFAWHLGDQGSAAQPAVDTIMDFNTQPVADGGDALDLRDLLQGENTAGGIGNLEHYLRFDTQDGHTVIKVSAHGDFVPGDAASGTDTQHIVLDHLDLRLDLALGAGASDAQVMAKLLQQGNLLVDHA